MFIIAHRLSAVKDANRIIVVDKGKLVEQGSHQQLVAHGGIYAQLYSIQNNHGVGIAAKEGNANYKMQKSNKQPAKHNLNTHNNKIEQNQFVNKKNNTNVDSVNSGINSTTVERPLKPLTNEQQLRNEQ